MLFGSYFTVLDPKKRCKDSRYLLSCHEEEEVVCGHGDIYRTYFCFFNQLELRLESRVHPTYASLLLSYQVMHGLTKLWLRNDHSVIIANSTAYDEIIYVDFVQRGQPQSYIYRIKTFFYGYLLKVRVSVLDNVDNNNVMVSMFDGPILVNSSYLYEMDKFIYVGGFAITYRVDIIASVQREGLGFDIHFVRDKSRSTDVSLSNLNNTFNTSSNTMDRDRIFYHKYFRVKTNTDDNFVKLSFTNIRELSGSSYNCEYGGYILSEVWPHHNHFIVNGPYCTQHGTEPLVNEVKTFHSTHPHLILIIYSYTFQTDVDISFESTPCQGITNICNLFCGQHATYRFQDIGKPLNYVVMKARESESTCTVQLQVIKSCVNVQQLSSRGGKICLVNINVRTGMIHTILHLQNNFRQVFLYIYNIIMV